jgi:hypothetical protein
MLCGRHDKAATGYATRSSHLRLSLHEFRGCHRHHIRLFSHKRSAGMNEESNPVMADEVEPVEEAVETEAVLESEAEVEENESAEEAESDEAEAEADDEAVADDDEPAE